MANRFLVSVLILVLVIFVPTEASAVNGVPNLLPFQGRLTDALGNPITAAGTQLDIRIYPPATAADAGCFIYDDRQIINPNLYGMFSIVLGVLGNRPGGTPANAFD